MKRLKSLLFILVIFASIFACDKPSKQIILTFIQHSFISFSYDENSECNGYYFENDELAKTTFTYELGYNLTSNDIENFNSSSLNYHVPTLNGDGYWSFTFFTISFDEKTLFSNNFLKPCELKEDLTIHFAIYG